jgi:hypothetical protein
VPWRDALDVAVKTLGYVVVEENRGILRVVDPVSLQAQMITQQLPAALPAPESNSSPDQVRVHDAAAAAAEPRGGQAQENRRRPSPCSQALRKALSAGGELDYIRRRT